MTTVILMALTAPLIAIPAVSAADSADWYKTVSGNLDSDAYSLYPYLKSSSLKIGFSKFGEMIDSNTNVGLEYGNAFSGGVDAFAPPYGGDIGTINKWAWLNGWLCNITYYHTIRSQYRNVWVSAQHGDPNGVTYGNDWIRVDFPYDWNITMEEEDPRDPGYIIGNYAAGPTNYGGRKTNGTAVTGDYQVLFNGPRSFVALLKTTIYDHFQYQQDSSAEDIALLEVRFMIVFNKVKREVVVFKELKTLVPDKYTDVLKVQFSNRGEVDLGDETAQYASYFHFYTQGQSQYNANFNDTLAEGRSTVYDRNWVLNQTENPATSPWKNYSASGPYPQVVPTQASTATYDLAVAINPEVGFAGVTWWAAFWPSLSDWSIDGWPMWWHSMTAFDPHDIDSRTWETYPRTEPTITYYIGEWDCELKPKGKTTPAGGYDQQQYRFVTVYGVTDVNDASDANMPARGWPYPPPSNTPDSETMYQLNEVFNPWDLNQAVHKTTRSWVEWATMTTSAGLTFTTARKPVVVTSAWNAYNVNSERVLDLNDTSFFGPLLYRSYYEYSITQNANGTATITIGSDSYFRGNLTGHMFKILYSTLPDVTGSNSYNVPWVPTTFYNISQLLSNGGSLSPPAWKDNIDVEHDWTLVIPTWTIYKTAGAATSGAATNWTESWSVTKQYDETDFKVFLGETYKSTLELYDPINVTTGNMTFMFDIGQFTKTLKSPTSASVIWPNDKSETVHVDYLNHTITFSFSLTQLNITDEAGVTLNSTWTIDQSLTGTANYRDYLMGRYEWTVVGRDAASVDSAGAALITAAFKNKQVEIGMAGADMYDPEIANQMPWVMSKMTSGNEWVNYLKTGAGTDPGNYRAYLRDDWCKAGTTSGDEWPIASSNMIGLGGPLANLLAYYGNDFTDAFFGFSTTDKGDFTDYAAWENKLVPKPCWNHTKGYTDTNTVGYATVTTYRDINETVLFLVWGNWGRDTFYVSRWFHEHLVYQLQDAPAGLTSVIVQINYQSTSEGYKPTSFSIVECLGTISERTWIHSSMTKGGIHDP